MAIASQSNVRNILLSALPTPSFERIAPYLDTVDLAVKDVLAEADEATPYIYFMESGLASIVASSADDGRRIEVGHVGWEGMSGVHVLHGSDRSPNRTFIQVAGSALRISAARLLEAIQDDWLMLQVLLRYVHAYEIQLAQTALANGHYKIEARLARWLLMYHDRLEGNNLPMTHEFLSLMLGVRRSGVTDQIHVLEGLHAIRASRSSILVQDRARLEEIAGGCYGVSEREYERLIGTAVSSRKPTPPPPRMDGDFEAEDAPGTMGGDEQAEA